MTDLSDNFNPQPKPEKLPKKSPKPLKRAKGKKKPEYDQELWDMFSIFIRLRDADENGYVKCCTCGKMARWRGDGMQAGHFVGRQHWGTRYNEKNVNTQCGGCNGPYGAGQQEKHAIYVDKLHGKGTAELLQGTRNGRKYTIVEMGILFHHYRECAEKLAKQKGLNCFNHEVWVK